LRHLPLTPSEKVMGDSMQPTGEAPGEKPEAQGVSFSASRVGTFCLPNPDFWVLMTGAWLVLR